MKLAGWLLVTVMLAPAWSQGTSHELEGMGDIAMGQGQFELAKAYYKEALVSDPRDAALWLKFERALEAYHQEVFARDAGGIAGLEALTDAAIGAPGGGGGRVRAFAPAGGGAAPPTATDPKVPAVRGPEEIIRLSRPVRPGKELLIAGPGGDNPVIVRGNTYEIDDIRFSIDDADVLHVTGRVENTSRRDMREPRIFVDLYDPGNNLWASGFGGVVPGPRALFPGKAKEFQVKFPGASRNVVGGFRVRVVGGG